MSTGANDVFALSIDTGEILWQYAANIDPTITSVCCGWNNKGVALSEDMVFIGQLDGKLVAIERATGRVAWSIQAERWQDNFSITSAPVYFDGMVITGFAGADKGTRGRVKAFDARDGRLVWTFYTIPAPGEPGSESWPKGSDAWKYGGASVWQTPAIDPELGLVYFSTGNAGPDYNGAVRAGDNLYAVSMVAVEVKTGKYKWHFQQVHHDIWDYDAVNPVILMDVNVGGRTRKAIAEVGKTGWAYILDRQTGKPLIGIDERPVPQEPRQKTAATQPFPRGDAVVPQLIELPPEGMKLVNDGRIFTPFAGNNPTIMLPGIWGGANWPPSAYDPVTSAPVRLRVVCGQRLHGGRRSQSRASRQRAGCAVHRRRRDLRARSPQRHHRRARRDDEQAGVAVSVDRPVLQRRAGDRRRPAVRRPRRRAAHRARLNEWQAALGVPDRRRDARASEHLRPQRQAVRDRVLGRERAAWIRARRQRLAVRSRGNAAASPSPARPCRGSGRAVPPADGSSVRLQAAAARHGSAMRTSFAAKRSTSRRAWCVTVSTARVGTGSEHHWPVSRISPPRFEPYRRVATACRRSARRSRRSRFAT